MDTQTGESFDFFRALFAALAVFVPIIIAWLQKKDKLQKTKYFIELMQSYDQLKTIREHQQTQSASPIVLEKLNNLIDDIEDEIYRENKLSDLRLFLTCVSVEIFFFIGILFIDFSENINKIFLGQSYESGMFFLEGVFRTTTARVILLMIFVSVSVFLTIRFSRRITGKTIKPLPINLKLLLAFHVFFIIVAVLVSILLASLDPIVPYW